MTQPTKPTDTDIWASGGGARKTAPSSALNSGGWSEGESPASDVFNYWKNKVDTWRQYADKVAAPVFDFVVNIIAERQAAPSGAKQVAILEAAQTSPPWREIWNIDTSDAGSGGDFLVCCSDGAYIYAINDDRIIKINPRTGTIAVNADHLTAGHFAQTDKVITNGTYLFVYNPQNNKRIELYRCSDCEFERTIVPTVSEEFSDLACDADYLYTIDVAGKVKAYGSLDTSPAVVWTNTDLTATTLTAIATTGDVVFVGMEDFDPGSGAVNFYALDADDGAEIWRTMVGGTGVNIDVGCLACDGDRVYAFADSTLYALPIMWTDDTNNPVEAVPSISNLTWTPKKIIVTERWMMFASVNISATLSRYVVGRKPAGGGFFHPSYGAKVDLSVNPSLRDICMTVDTFAVVTVDQGGGAGNKTIIGYRLPLRPNLIQVDDLAARYRPPFFGAVTEGF